MNGIFALIFVFSLALLLIGIVSPKTSLFWDNEQRTKRKSAKIYGILTILSLIFFNATNHETKTTNNDKTDQQTVAATTTESEPQLTQAQQDSIAKVEKEQELVEIKQNDISAPQLTAAYEENEVNADQNFKGKTFYVTGRITEIKKDILDDIYVTLQGDEMFREVQCYFNDASTASQLRKGMKVTFRGKCDGLMMNVQMKNCELVDNPK